MFRNLREARSLLMGLAICGVAFYHAPFIIHNVWLSLFHSSLNGGVDLFLFLSGLGACHSIARRGGRDYLRQRAKRLLPGLYLVMLVWCAVMLAMGLMTAGEFLGNVTLLGWWLGMNNQLNWYFSAVWLFYLLAVPLYRLFCKTRHPILLWLGLTAVSVALGVLCPWDWYMTAVARLPIFLTGMLFGRLEQTGFPHERRLRCVLFLLMLVGLWMVPLVGWGLGYTYGYSLGLWWYPYALVTPGLAVLIANLAALLRKRTPLAVLMRPIECCGESSAEILMIHIAVYKVILATTHFRNRYWLMILTGCLVLGCLYHYFVVPRLRLPRRASAS